MIEFDPWSFQDGSYLLYENRHLAQLADEISEIRGSELHKQRAETMLQPEAQELLLLDEVLGSLLGLEGNFVRLQRLWHLGLPEFRFHLVDEPKSSLVFDVSLRNIIEKEFLPLSSSYVNIAWFLGSHLNRYYDYGTVMQALCEKLDTTLYEYARFVIGLETQYRERIATGANRLSAMRWLLADIQTTAHKMRVLQHVVEAVRTEKGGALLNALERTRRLYDGDVIASGMVSVLLDASAVPYMRAFCQWIQSGRLEDPYNEFMVHFDSEARTWMDQYSIVNKHALVRFCASEATLATVVATGRFWNAIRMCPGRVAANNDEHAHSPIMYSSKVSDVLARIQALHLSASRTLVDLLLRECDVFRSLRLTKRYFLLDQGDFFVRFMDAAEDELLKDSTDISLGRIQHWLSSAIYLTDQDASADKQSRSPCCSLLPSDLVTRFTTNGLLFHLDKLLASPSVVDSNRTISGSPRRERPNNANPDEITGLDTFLIDFKSIPFPLSLVLTKQAMASYQLLFRHLFYTKYVERRLVGIWQDHQALRELQALRGALGRTFLLRQRMLHFVQNLVYYMMLEVIEPNWSEFENEVLASDALMKLNADDICTSHARFLRKTLGACLMTNRDVLGSITKLLGTCLLFTNEMKTFMHATKLEDDRRSVTKEKRIRLQRTLTERSVSRHSSLSRLAVEKILIEDIAERRARVQQQTTRVQREVSSQSYRLMIARFDEVFSGHLSDFMLQLKYADGLVHSHKSNLCTRLDYNGYTSRAFGLSESVRRNTHKGILGQP
jgi:gamma-tubulin complex component 2